MNENIVYLFTYFRRILNLNCARCISCVNFVKFSLTVKLLSKLVMVPLRMKGKCITTVIFLHAGVLRFFNVQAKQVIPIHMSYEQ